MARIVPFCLLGLLIMFTGQSFGAQPIVVQYDFQSPEILEISIAGEQYHRLVMPDAPNGGNVGEPALPSRGAQILLPQGTRVESIEVIAEETLSLGYGYYIEPVPPPVPLVDQPGVSALPEPDPVIYTSAGLFPAKPYQEIGTFSFRGYEILVLKLDPVAYRPESGELVYYPRLTVVVNVAPKPEPNPLYRGLAVDDIAARQRVDNAEAAMSYPSAASQVTDAYDMLIITHPYFVSIFQPLKDYHDSTGVLCEIHTIDDIGSSDPADIREYIRQEYLQHGIQYVLLGGDDEVIPAADLYVYVGYTMSGELAEQFDMPGDVYYACLDGNFNSDGDTLMAEPTDGEGGGDVDLMAEVYVGRVPCDDGIDIQRLVNKTLDYVASQDEYLRKVLLAGEKLIYGGGGGIAQYAANFIYELVDSTSACGYSTVGIPSSGYEIDELFDRDWEDFSWPPEELIDRIEAGVHIISHIGHAGDYLAMKLELVPIVLLTNDKYFFAYMQGCNAGAFDYTESPAEYFTVKSSGGAFAVISNSRWGWGVFGTSDGVSHRYNREFWDAVFNPEENKPQLGWANQDSKEDNLYRINLPAMRWTYYALNLFGDPALQIRRPEILTFDYPSGLPETVSPDSPTSFEVNVSGRYGGMPVSGSGMLHYALDDGDTSSVPMVDLGGDTYLAELPAVDCDVDSLRFLVSAEEAGGELFYGPTRPSSYAAIPAETVLVVLEDDFETDLGWTVSGDATAGHWERGVPDGVQSGAPPTDYDGSGSCYLTGLVADPSDVDGGMTYLDSPTLNLQYNDAQVRFASWFSNNLPSDQMFVDVLNVYLSNDGGANWTLAETIGPTFEAYGDWYEHAIWVSSVVQPTDQVKVRFEAGDPVYDSHIEAAIDAVSIVRYRCVNWTCGDFNEDGKITLSDISRLIDFLFVSQSPLEEYPAGNVNGSEDGKITLSDVSRLIDHVYISRQPLQCL